MKINDSILQHLENLSRVKIDDEERDGIKEDMNRILEYMKCLDEIDVESYDPMISPIEFSDVNDSRSHLREDEIVSGCSQQKFLENAPSTQDGLIRVPEIIS